MIGTRVYPNEQGLLVLKPGCYGKATNGEWLARPPSGVHTGSLSEHEVTEHEDGTITVSPSILIDEPTTKGSIQWHGYLEKGVWREV